MYSNQQIRAAALRGVAEILMQSSEGANDELNVKVIEFLTGEQNGWDIPQNEAQSNAIYYAQDLCAKIGRDLRENALNVEREQ